MTENNKMTEGDKLAKHLANAFRNAVGGVGATVYGGLVTIGAAVATNNILIVALGAFLTSFAAAKVLEDFAKGLEMPLEEEKPAVPAAKPKTPGNM